jgi:hypothetical protein
MTERLVDVLNEKENVLQVFVTSVEDPAVSPKNAEYEQEALKAAADAKLVPEPELDGLRARMHVSRGGQLTPYGAKKP